MISMKIIPTHLLGKISILVVVLLLCTRVNAQDTIRLSLADAMKRIEQVYPDIKKYQSKIKSLQAKTEGAKAWMPPTVSVGLSRFPYDPSMLKEEGPMNQAGIMIAVEQMIPNPGKLSAKKDYLQSLTHIQSDNLQWIKNILRHQGKYFFYEIVMNEKKLRVVAENRELLNLLISTSKNKYPYDQSELSTIFKAKAKLEELRNMETMILSSIAESSIGLNTLMNRDVSTVFSVDTTVTFSGPERPLTSIDTLINRRSDLLAMQDEIASMRYNREYMNSFSKPDFGIRLEHMQMFGMPSEYSIMGMVTVPIVPWSAGMYTSDVRSMEYEIEAMTREQESMQLMAKKMLSEKSTMLSFEQTRLQNYENGILPAYKEVFESGLLAYRQNTGNFFVLLDAWEMLLMKKMEYYDVYLKALHLQADYEYEIEQQ